MIKKMIIAIQSVLCVLILVGVAFSWNESTHMILSEYSATESILSNNKGDYLKRLGFSKGFYEELQWNGGRHNVNYWIQIGAFDEDEGSRLQGVLGTARYINHFHNPLQLSWPDAGLNDWAVFHYTGESSILWAQDSAKQQNWLGGDWSWKATRTFFINALTANTDATRQASFAKMFKGLGHQLHLIQDAAQPDHVRNDAHPLDGGGLTVGIETWTKNNVSDLPAITAYDLPTMSLVDSINGLVPVSRLFDADIYQGATPIAMSDTSVGLAEWTNANFFSDDTINLPGYGLINNQIPYPNAASTNLQSYLSENKWGQT